jgi:hypothetical protein
MTEPIGDADAERMPESAEADPSEEEIRQRAFEISQGPDAGTPEENWHRAREELRAKQ